MNEEVRRLRGLTVEKLVHAAVDDPIYEEDGYFYDPDAVYAEARRRDEVMSALLAACEGMVQIDLEWDMPDVRDMPIEYSHIVRDALGAMRDAITKAKGEA